MTPTNSAAAQFGLGVVLCGLVPWLISCIPTPGELSSRELRDLDTNPSCRAVRLLPNTLESVPAPDAHGCEVESVRVIDKTDLVVLRRHRFGPPPLHYDVTIQFPSGLAEELLLGDGAFHEFNGIKQGETLKALVYDQHHAAFLAIDSRPVPTSINKHVPPLLRFIGILSIGLGLVSMYRGGQTLRTVGPEGSKAAAYD